MFRCCARLLGWWYFMVQNECRVNSARSLLLSLGIRRGCHCILQEGDIADGDVVVRGRILQPALWSMLRDDYNMGLRLSPNLDSMRVNMGEGQTMRGAGRSEIAPISLYVSLTMYLTFYPTENLAISFPDCGASPRGVPVRASDELQKPEMGHFV